MDIGQARSVLGISGDRLSQRDLVGAWRRYARETHPDRRPGDPQAAERFAAGREAYEALRAARPVPPPPASPTPVAAAARVDRDPPPLREVLRGPLAAARAQPYAFPAVAAREWRA